MRADGGVVAYFAPGGGLGHLNRALAVCLRLRDEGVDARIVTNSPFAAGLAGLARCPIVRLPGEAWAAAAQEYVEAARPAAVVTDTFPYGLRDEWRGAGPGTPLVHVARRLMTPFAIVRADFAAIIQAEPLAAGHAAALGERVVLPGPIRLAPGRVATPLPAELDRDGLTLVVHSGPEEELRALVELTGGECTVIAPWTQLEYYPATNLYARARRVITGAGYNSMADLLGMREKHTAVPFARRYDDQHARVREFFAADADGTAAAAAAIRSVL